MINSIRNVSAVILIVLSFSACGGELKYEKKFVLERDSRNSNVDFSLTSKKQRLRYCVNNLSDEASAMDVFRVLPHSAELLKDWNFDKIELCFRKEIRFILGGGDFKIIGENLDTQNPIYTIRTFPEKLSLPDGESAYKAHKGGLLYLMRVQIADF